MQTANISQHGFGEFEIPDVSAYVQSYSKRGNPIITETTPVYQQARFGNRVGKGGMGTYVSQVEDPLFFESLKTKKGNHGVYETVRWNPGYDWRGNFGISSLDASKNYVVSTRGGRNGSSKRSAFVDRPGYWFEVVRPGLETSRMSQNSENYSGVFEQKRTTPTITREMDFSILREMIEHNPFHVRSHAALQAKEMYDYQD